MDFAPKQRKSRQDSIHCKFVMWSKVWYREQFVVDPHNKITPHDKLFCHVEQVCLSCEIFVPHDHQQFSCEAKLLHIWYFGHLHIQPITM